ncbi:FAD:protein FMN transferase [Sedimentitalea sp. HM32M-2]|uniref:FAD:protein FMN transferase n=1 Tax=Sedimentitalea sp. HM32M-2 TaxID=3351566 RepID=UPI0036263C3E
MTETVTRRRFLTISAAAGLCSATATAAAAAAPTAHWTGRALGAQTSMQLAGLTETEARSIFRAVERELARLERVFSLYRTDSQLVQLNRTGVLRAPAPEMLELLSLCDRLYRATGGAFDPSLQPLWMLYARAATRGSAPTPQERQEARDLVGWRDLRVATDEVRFARPGMALTLNGVAQGYVTDRVAALLTQRGLRDVLIDMGEIAALGRRADGDAWTAGVALPDGQLVQRVVLKDRALATSAPEGTLLDEQRGVGHILDPRGQGRTPRHRLVSVSSSSAAVADGLSTAGCLLDLPDLAHAIGTFPDTTLETVI